MLVSDIKVLSASEIATVLDRKEELYDVPEWGGPVLLRALSLSERDEMVKQATVDGKIDGQRITILLVVSGIAEPKLTEAIIRERSFEVVDRLASKLMQLNGMNKEVALSVARTF